MRGVHLFEFDHHVDLGHAAADHRGFVKEKKSVRERLDEAERGLAEKPRNNSTHSYFLTSPGSQSTARSRIADSIAALAQH